MKRAITLPAIAAVFTLLAAPVHAAQEVVTNEMYPITGPFTYTPSTSCGCPSGDTVTMKGVFHMLVQAQTGPTGVVEMHGNLIHAVGTSTVTGCTYHAVGSAKLASNTPGPTPFTGTYEVIPPGGCEHTTVQVNGEVWIDPDGRQNPALSQFVFGPFIR
jgi:hypothetical protein